MSRRLLSLSLLLWLGPFAVQADVYSFEAREQSARTFFSELSGPLGRPVIVSKVAAAKRIGGTFDLRTPQQTFERISTQMGLIWYSDGQAIYLYDASEIKSSMASLQTLTVVKLLGFLKQAGLHDARYPLRHDGLRTFHVSGPPIYVDLVLQAAQLMDNQRSELLLGKQQIGVIQVRNTFVSDRKYELRDDKVTIPGLATVIEALLRGEQHEVEPSVAQASPQRSRGAMPAFPLQGLANTPSEHDPTAPRILAREVAAGNIRVVAYPDTNSLLVKGLPEQVRFIENLVNALDTPKRHVELSLWIIDLHKDELNQLGINWQGALKSGGTFSASLNAGSATTLDGASFVTRVLALERTQRANVVSRPVILTQENVPAIFDNNRTFYAPLVGERSVDLQHVTYGTLVSVLPRFAQADEIEMSLNIEDGNEVESPGQGALPTVGRTRISTVARVPQGKSLLVGGFTRDDHGEQIGRVPVLGSIPWLGRLFSYRQDRSANTVRVFLIQPQEIREALESVAIEEGGPLLTPQQHERLRRSYFRMSAP
ncbi:MULTISPECIES: type III secretion system outer membrane ring subunit SctC [Pseudomonas]|uniref:type III secretion system outer membrane ring subunit SctC n=1 Tax=Pseudomonas TaxID=286 RepID=UPI001BEAEE14|nr:MULTISPECIES: type III secretion system outer membrane ring subunit SctC [Pseudomonas]MBT2339718.1 type III secretion system outer membrane ring subunit SctC [Pseudomonas fluorescens]MCD4531240.1 type III secretion system outer membrane ring subunit SctC [Pseudomonas sp. C3-2018]